jgi:ATP/maltotriose-dependent transcriptional regulator MalT
VAVELAELACRLTPPESAEARARRMLELARYLLRAGDAERGRGLVEAVIGERPAGPVRAEALELLARVLHVAGTAAEAAAHCDQALLEAGDDVELRARIHATRALVSWHDFELARQHARAALELLQRREQPDPVVLSLALMAFVEAEVDTGHRLPMDAVRRGLELERVAPAASVADRMSGALGVWLTIDGDYVAARRWLTATHQAVIDEGDEGSLPYVIGHLVQLELWSGDWPEAERLAREHLELAEAMAQPDQRRQALFNLAIVQAHQGREAPAREAAHELLRDAGQAEDSWGLANAEAALGFLEASLGRPSEAAAHLKRNVELRTSIGSSEPFRSVAEYAEVLIDLGELDLAEVLIGRLEHHKREAGRLPLLAVVARCRGRLAAERRDLDGALAAFDEAVAHHERRMVQFDHARTLLAMGEVLRRSGQRRAAADALARAAETFDRLGATLWAARAQADLRRIPIRRRVGGELTATEEQVAQLAAEGATNREVAQTLFMAPKTVEANLSRIYRKLGIHSRAELGAKVAERKRGPPAPKP